MSVQFHLDHYPLDVEVRPLGWLVTSVRALCGEPQPGFASGQHNRDGRGVVHLRPMNVDCHGYISLDEVKYVAADATLRVQHGDVLFNNTNSPAWVGKSAAILRPTDWAFSNHMTRLRPSTGVDARFLAAQLQYLQQSGYFRHLCVNHVNQASISSGVIGDAVPVLLAPEREQVRIADRIDELFTALAAGVKALERVKRNLSRYHASVLYAAITGQLTASWRKQHGTPDEPGPRLLDRILAERRRIWEHRTQARYDRDGKQPPKNWRSRYPEPFPPGTLAHGAALPSLPDTWCWATHDQVGDVQLGRQRAPEHHTGAHMRPYLRVANVYEDRIDTSDVLQMNFTPEEFETYKLRHGDILLNEGQSMELVGRPAMYRDELPGGCFQNTLVRQRAIAPLVPEYALIVCLAQFRAGRFRKIASITTSIAHLGAQRFAALEFPLPPIAEQEAIIDIVKEKLSLIDALTLESQRGLARAARLRQAILKAAFEGKLVSQDPADEPASVLLDRIRQQASEPTPKSNGDGDAANGTVQRRRGRPPGSRKATSEAPGVAPVAVAATERRSRKAKVR
jgi:type I restriction enzyme S subunit